MPLQCWFFLINQAVTLYSSQKAPLLVGWLLHYTLHRQSHLRSQWRNGSDSAYNSRDYVKNLNQPQGPLFSLHYTLHYTLHCTLLHYALVHSDTLYASMTYSVNFNRLLTGVYSVYKSIAYSV